MVDGFSHLFPAEPFGDHQQSLDVLDVLFGELICKHIVCRDGPPCERCGRSV